MLSDLPLEDRTLLFLDDASLLIVQFYFVKLVCKKANLADRTGLFGIFIMGFQYLTDVKGLAATKLRLCVDFWRLASLVIPCIAKCVIGLCFTDTGGTESGPLVDHHHSSLVSFTLTNEVSRGHRR